MMQGKLGGEYELARAPLIWHRLGGHVKLCVQSSEVPPSGVAEQLHVLHPRVTVTVASHTFTGGNGGGVNPGQLHWQSDGGVQETVPASPPVAATHTAAFKGQVAPGSKRATPVAQVVDEQGFVVGSTLQLQLVKLVDVGLAASGMQMVPGRAGQGGGGKGTQTPEAPSRICPTAQGTEPGGVAGEVVAPAPVVVVVVGSFGQTTLK
jgi:hypothetical protein